MISAKKLKPLLKDYENGMIYKDLAEKYDLTLTAVFKAVHKYGTPRTRKFSEDVVDKIRHLYIDEDKTLLEVSLAMDMTVNQVRGIFHKYDFVKSDPNRIKPYEDFSKPIKTVVDPIYYPEKKVLPKKIVVIDGKKYQDVSEYYGL